MTPGRMPGYGDEQTWAPCTGHPLDPRTPDTDEIDLVAVIDDAMTALDRAKDLLQAGDIERGLRAMSEAATIMGEFQC
jgi:hypothetical protein